MTGPKDADYRPETGDGRAQPGDVLGVDRDGERTHLGETREDEDKRRNDAEKAVDDRDDRTRDK
jgi:hypothetical protein